MDIIKIKQEKLKRGYTNKDLSEKTGIPLGTINKILSGHTKSIKSQTHAKIVKELFKEEVCNCDFNEEFYGFIKCCSAQSDVKVGDVEYNVKNIINKIESLDKLGVSLAVFPELSVSGYTCGDLFFNYTLLKAVEKGLLKIAQVTKDFNMLIFVGAPLIKDGKLYDCAVAINKGSIIGVVPKETVDNYACKESRWFSCAPIGNSLIIIGDKQYPFGKNLIFKDVNCLQFTVGVEVGNDKDSCISPAQRACLNGANVIVNLSAEEELVGLDEYRKNLVSAFSKKCKCAYLYSGASSGESTAEGVYGGKKIIAENGKILFESQIFSGKDVIADVDVEFIENERLKNFQTTDKTEFDFLNFDACRENCLTNRSFDKTPFIAKTEAEEKSRAKFIIDVLTYALKKRIEHINCKTVVLGVSGGLDSTLALIVAEKAIKLAGRPSKDIIAVTMPCFGTTKRTKSNAEKMSEALGVTFKTVDITQAVKVHFNDIGHDGVTTDITYENAQARERTQVLMDIANAMDGIVIGTGDLSESALGWATYNGDHMSMYGVNSSIPKTLIRSLISYEAERTKNIKLADCLKDVLDTPVSPELIPAEEETIKQKTEDIVGPYELHDFFIYNFVRRGYSPKKLFVVALKAFKDCYKAETIYKWLNVFIRRFFVQQFKRSCMPDSAKTGSVNLSSKSGWVMPSDATRNLWIKELEELKEKLCDC